MWSPVVSVLKIPEHFPTSLSLSLGSRGKNGGATGGGGGLDQKGLVLQAVSRDKRLWASGPSQNTCRDSLDSQTSGPITSTLKGPASQRDAS